MHTNNTNFILTGTNFGLLNAFPRAEYFDGYYFTDFSGSDNINYTNTVTGGIFIEEHSEEEIPTDGMLFWLDASDVSTLAFNESGNIVSINDKSGNLDIEGNVKEFKSGNSEVYVLTAFWPVYNTGSFTTEQEILSNFKVVSGSTINCARFLQNAFLQSSGFNINFNEESHTMFIVWKDNNTLFRTIPFSLKTQTGSVTSEFVAHMNYGEDTIDPPIAWGTRGTGSLIPGELPVGFRVNSLSSVKLFNVPNITFYNSPPGILTEENYFLNELDIDNNNITPDDYYFHTYYIDTPYNTIGYLDENNKNDFYLGEMLLYNRVLDSVEKDKIFNYLAKKWYLKDITRDNVTFDYTVSGGSLKNSFYEDFLVQESYFSIPIQECTTMLSIVLSSFDESTSEISKIVCSYNNNVYKLETPINIDPVSAANLKSLRKIDILLNPSGEFHRNSYYIYLSVYKFDTTINRITLSGELLKCGINDLYYNNYLLDSQLSNTSSKVFLLNEDRNNKQIFVNSINISTPNQALSGGEEVTLQNIEFLETQESIFSLAELLGIVQQETVTYKRPVISPVINPNINPVSPT